MCKVSSCYLPMIHYHLYKQDCFFIDTFIVIVQKYFENQVIRISMNCQSDSVRSGSQSSNSAVPSSGPSNAPTITCGLTSPSGGTTCGISYTPGAEAPGLGCAHGGSVIAGRGKK